MNEIDEQGSKAFQHYLASSSVAINSLTPGFEHGTGVAVRYRGEHYIVTADHILERELHDENLLIIGRPDSALKEIEKLKSLMPSFMAPKAPLGHLPALISKSQDDLSTKGLVILLR